MTQPQFKIDQGHLARIIAANDTALEGARTNQAGVQADSDTVKAALIAASGNTLGTGLVDWASDFQAIINALQELQTKAQALKAKSESTDEDASTVAATPMSGGAPPYSL